MRRVLLTLFLAVSSFMAVAPAARASATDAPIYLALGDSLAFGYQPVGFLLGHGYAQQLAATLRHTTPSLQLKDLGCVGETTDTMLGNGGTICPYMKYTSGVTTTPQIVQAINFLQSHQGQVKLITIDIGVNDILKALSGHLSSGEITALAQRIAQNLNTIYSDVVNAAPGVKIVTMTYYNPLVVFSNSPGLTAGAQLFNGIITTQAAQHGIAVADVYQAFNGTSDPGATICKLTWFCSLFHFGDLHPRTAGYTVITNEFVKAGAANI